MKKPIIVEAIQYSSDKIFELQNFVDNDCLTYDTDLNKFGIKTLEGVMYISENDYIIKGTRGEFYPCKPEAFKDTYTKVLYKK